MTQGGKLPVLTSLRVLVLRLPDERGLEGAERTLFLWSLAQNATCFQGRLASLSGAETHSIHCPRSHKGNQ